MNLLQNLNEQQKRAILKTEGPLLVIAGAGAGKTKVITHRTAHLIKTGVKPNQILAVTFTNKAANEMKERIQKLIFNIQHSIFNTPTVGTFHSICSRILRENAENSGLTKNFSIIDKEDSLKLIRNGLKELNINPKQFQPHKIQAIISRQKSDLVTLEEFAESGGNNFFPKTIALVWQEYEKKLKKQNAADFDDLITETVYLFQKKPEILEKYQDRWRYILIDEYQDTNHSQYVLTKSLAQKHRNICVVGDEDQSIYSWRGADFKNILNFEKDWPDAEVIMLEENYRSHQKILQAANSVISRNTLRKPKNLFSRTETGSNISIFQAMNEAEEASFVAAKSLEIINKGASPKEIAVLYRANFQSRILEELFLAYDLPYQVVGTRFFERKEIKDVISYLKAGLNTNDILSIERIINEPARGIGPAGLLSYFANKKLPEGKKTKIESFFKLLKQIEEAVKKLPTSKLISIIAQKSGYETLLKSSGKEEGQIRLDNLKELIALASRYDGEPPPFGTMRFLEDAALLSDQDSIDSAKNGVKLMTVHAAKGLEFESVFVSGLEEGLFPYPSFDGPFGEEEERRLFYVALTRAKKQIFLSYSISRNFFGGKQINKPSKFLNEVPAELIEPAEAEEIKFIDYQS